MKMEGLEIHNIYKSFGDTTILEGISFQLEKGEILALLGPSGSGKTTLLEIIAGLDDPDQGDCLWDGKSLLGVPTHLRNFGLMFQEYVLFPHKTVGENVAFGLKMAGGQAETTATRVKEVLDLVGLSGFENRDPSTLSGGEQQRIALARSLAPEPRLVMLDEPLGALDRAIRERLVGELRIILKKASQTALYVTHDQEEAFSIADRVVILGNGNVAQMGKPMEIYYQPNSAYVAQFLGMNNLVDGVAQANQHGSMLKTNLGNWQVRHKYEGKGSVLLRSDQIHLGSGERQGFSSLTGTVLNSTFSGSAIQTEIEVKNTKIKFSTTNPEAALPNPGESITIWFKPDDVLHFFPN